MKVQCRLAVIAIMVSIGMAYLFGSSELLRAQEDINPEEEQTQAAATDGENYYSLSLFSNRISEQASSQFHDFFGPEIVNVAPFRFLEEQGKGKITLLGMTLADLMIARINNDSVHQPGVQGENEQWLDGILQEVDGYLRIHIFGVNVQGDRRSFVVHVEMSKPVYRALHTYVSLDG